MDLASRMIWRFGCPMSVRHKQFFCQITKCSFNFCHLTEFFFSSSSFHCQFWQNSFSVNSSWEVHWIIMFQKDAVCTSDRLFIPISVLFSILAKIALGFCLHCVAAIALPPHPHLVSPAALVSTYEFLRYIFEIVITSNHVMVNIEK